MSKPQQEFHRPIAIDSLDDGRATSSIAATAAECAALAKRFGLVGLDRLEARIELRRRRGGVIAVNGDLRADITQTCIVTLEPVPARIEESFAVSYTREHRHVAVHEVALDPDAEQPEPVDGGAIDLGELTAQQLSLALPPYPRAPGAQFDPIDSGEAAAAKPFAGLARLKPRP